MKRLKFLTGAFFITLALLFTPKQVRASEGTVELESTTTAATRCFASSVLMQNLDYKITVSCRNLIYPPSENQFAYILWAVPKGGGGPFKLGNLGFGKAEFKTRDAFSELFVTTETNDLTRGPSGNVVARGFVRQIELLEKENKPQTSETESSESTQPAQSFREILEQPTPTPTITAATGGILSGLRRSSLLLVVVIFVILLFLAFLTRARG